MFLSPVDHKDEIIPEEYYVVTILPSEDGEDGPLPITNLEKGSELINQLNFKSEEDSMELIGWYENQFHTYWVHGNKPNFDKESYVEIQLINQYISVNEQD